MSNNYERLLAYLDKLVSEAEAELRYADEFRDKAAAKVEAARQMRNGLTEMQRASTRDWQDRTPPTPIDEEDSDHD